MSTTTEKRTQALKRKELIGAMSQCYGSINIYKHWTGLKYTDGIHAVAEIAQAYWLLDIVASYQVKKSIRQEDFQVWSLTVDHEQGTGVIVCTDGNSKKLAKQKIHYTDFPLEEWSCYVIDGIMLLPSEY